MTKEMLAYGQTEMDALHNLCTRMAEYRSENRVMHWEWVIRPEANHLIGEWRAYGRIEFEK